MRQLHQLALDQITTTYKQMASQARYRPAAPSDGLGNITEPLDTLDLDAEADDYAHRWWQEESEYTFWIGCANHPTRPATIYAVEAARLLCGAMTDDVALNLLRMAVADLERKHP